MGMIPVAADEMFHSKRRISFVATECFRRIATIEFSPAS